MNISLIAVISIIGGIVSIAGTVIAGSWFVLRAISSQLYTLHRELENKMEAGDARLGDRLGGRMQRLEDRMDRRMQKLEDGQKKLEDGQADLRRQIAHLSGVLNVRLPSSEEPQTT